MPAQLPEVLASLESLAPTALAGDWDNVGLLLGVLDPDAHRVARVLLTIDWTVAVAEEALDVGADLVVAYHPPIFRPLPRLVGRAGVERAVLLAARHGLPIWSPHTALDAVPGGVNDWLADGLGKGSRVPIEPAAPDLGLAPGAGQGRLVVLAEPAPLDDLVDRIKRHLDLDRVRLARAPGGRDEIRTVALCPGAGGSVLGGRDADLLWTGEMRHHDVLAAGAAGRHVVLCEHTNTERGYLPRFADLLRARHPDLEVSVSRADRDPHALA